MNRFEQTRKPYKHTFVRLLFPSVGFILLLLFFLGGIRSVNDTTLKKQQESLETALTRSISQCYAVEGTYPPSLEYLITNYGLAYDDNTFFVDYEYYGGNLFPEVTVLRKQK